MCGVGKNIILISIQGITYCAVLLFRSFHLSQSLTYIIVDKSMHYLFDNGYWFLLPPADIIKTFAHVTNLTSALDDCKKVFHAQDLKVCCGSQVHPFNNFYNYPDPKRWLHIQIHSN
jgi:hypothetical protein